MYKFLTKSFLQIEFVRLKGLALMALAFLTFSVSNSYGQVKNPAPYCMPNTSVYNSICNGQPTVEKIKLNNLNFNTPCPATRAIGYNFYQAASFPNYTTDLIQGATYTMSLSASSPWSNMNIGIWIDFNRDNDFSDASEFIGQTGMFNMSLKDGKLTFTVPCTGNQGVTRLRCRLSSGWNATWKQSDACGYPNYPLYGEGEDLDFEVNIMASPNPTANFQIPDTIFQNSPAQFYNTNQAGYTHEWYVDEGSGFNYASDLTNLNYIFMNAGKADVRVVSTNCTGTATTTKTVTVIAPKDIPTPQFYASLTNIEVKPGTLYQGDKDIFMYDFSTGGPDTWDWTYTSPDVDEIAYFIEYYDQNPLFIALDTGIYSICMTVSNVNGSNTMCKNDYIVIDYPKATGNSSTNMLCVQTSSTLDSGTLYDDGGPDGNYSNNSFCTFTIAGCDAQEIELTLSQLDINCGDYLNIYDGKNSLAPRLKGFEYINNNPPKTKLVAKSGYATIELISNNYGPSDCFNTSDGFELKWKSINKNDGGPKANFSIPKSKSDTVFSCSGGTNVQFQNLSTGSRVFTSTQWIFDYSPSVNYPVGFANSKAANPSYSYLTTNKWYNVRLVVESCEGMDTVIRSFFLANTSTLAKIDFTASESIIYPNQTVTITNTSAAECKGKWSISPSSWKYESGGDSTDVIVVKFLKAGRYHVTRSSTNDIGTTSKTKSDFIKVIDYCEPTAQFLSTEAGISYVKFATIDNQSASAENAFENFTSVGTAQVTMGQTYDFEMARKGNTDPVDRKVWIDFDRNGTYSSNELVASETNSHALSFKTSITMPDYKNAISGLMRMRVACAIAGTPLTPCGPVKLGEYEDYLLNLMPDEVLPVLTIKGLNPVYLELGQAYNDSGATAFDNIQGDLTNDIVTSNYVNVNQTGVNEVIYEITDNSGLKARAVRRVIVKADITNPVITIAGGNNIIHEVNTPFTAPTASVNDNPGNKSINYQIISNNVNEKQLGVYEVVYEAIDEYGNSTTEKLVVEVKDQTAPVFHLNGSNPYTLQLGVPFVDPTTVTDNYDNSFEINLSVTGLLNTNVRDTNYILTYTATDKSGNTTTIQRRYVVADFIAPTINTLAGTEHMIVEVKSKFTEPSVTVSDNFGGATLTRDGGGFDINKIGTYTIKYVAKDLDGNTTNYTRVIEVQDSESPVVQNGVININQWEIFNPNDFSQIYVKDNYYSSDDFKNGTNGCKIVALNNDVKSQTPGLYYACYQAVDGSGNFSPYNCILVKVAESTSGINSDAFANTINIYPNPSKGEFVLSFDKGVSDNVKISITNMIGETIAIYNYNDLTNGKISIDLNEKAAGVYFVNIQDENQIASKKITITK